MFEWSGVKSSVPLLLPLFFVILIHSIPINGVTYNRNTLLSDLFEKYGENNSLNATELDRLLQRVNGKYVRTVMNEYVFKEPRHSQEWSSSSPLQCNDSDISPCLKHYCLTGYDVYTLLNLSYNHRITTRDIESVLPIVLYEAQKVDCQYRTREDSHSNSAGSTWGFGILFVFLISLFSMGGALILPFANKAIYNQIMFCLVGLAVGSLFGTSVLVLIPKALHIYTDEMYRVPMVTKAIAITGGVYLFFLIERLLKMLMVMRQKKYQEARDDYVGDVVSGQPKDNMISSFMPHSPALATRRAKQHDLATVSDKSLTLAVPSLQNSEIPGSHPEIKVQTLVESPSGNDIEIKEKLPPNHIASIAWMIIFGDGLHNFIDGLSIGAAFSESTMTGISVSVAVMCEEIPHELGDFAILLKSGLSFKRAILFNFLSALTCYLGLIIGILLGEIDVARQWIFAIAAGMFMYISLVDMLPEMNSSAEEIERTEDIACSWPVFTLQNLGLIVGYVAIVLLTLYGDNIQIT